MARILLNQAIWRFVIKQVEPSRLNPGDHHKESAIGDAFESLSVERRGLVSLRLSYRRSQRLENGGLGHTPCPSSGRSTITISQLWSP